MPSLYCSTIDYMSKNHEIFESHHSKKTASDFSFAMTFCFIFLALSFYGFFQNNFSPPTLIVSALFGLIGLIKPSLLSPFNKLWTQFGLLLNKVTQPILMFILFFGFLTPLAILFRLFTKKGLHLSPDPKVNSYWIKKEAYDSLNESMKNQF